MTSSFTHNLLVRALESHRQSKPDALPLRQTAVTVAQIVAYITSTNQKKTRGELSMPMWRKARIVNLRWKARCVEQGRYPGPFHGSIKYLQTVYEKIAQWMPSRKPYL
jgi:hypothetical protein